ncbi:MAG: 5-formyltetrahydrofolate cyclo-ligase [Verrucomicrobiota bacterium]
MRPSKGEAAQAGLRLELARRPANHQLRQEMRRILQGISAEARIQCSKGVCQQLERHDAWRQASSVLFYAALGDELDLGNLLETALLEKKLVALPQFDPGTGAYRASAVTTPVRELRAGRYGIPEPDSECVAHPSETTGLDSRSRVSV